jgi:hypothetical protein
MVLPVIQGFLKAREIMVLSFCNTYRYEMVRVASGILSKTGNDVHTGFCLNINAIKIITKCVYAFRKI